MCTSFKIEENPVEIFLVNLLILIQQTPTQSYEMVCWYK